MPLSESIWLLFFVTFSIIGSTPSAAPPKVQGITIERTVQHSKPALNVSWTRSIGNNTSYTVCYSTVEGTKSNPPNSANCSSNGISGTSTTLGPLIAGTTYHIWVGAVASGEKVLYSDRQQEMTYKVPGYVRGISVSKTLSSNVPALLVTWSPLQGDVPVTRYEVNYLTPPPNEKWRTKTVKGHSKSRTFPKLITGAVYKFRVRAVSAIGPGKYSNETSQTTFTVPKQVTGLQYTLNENNSSSYQALLTWPPAKNETSVVTYYEMLSWANDERSPAVVKLYQESTTIGLSSEDVYRVTVRAGSPLGMGDWSVLLRIEVNSSSKTSSNNTGGILPPLLFVAGLLAGSILILLALGIIWAVRKRVVPSCVRHREEVGGAVRDVDMVDSPAYACTEQHVYDHPQVRPNTATAVNSYKNIAVMSDSSH